MAETHSQAFRCQVTVSGFGGDRGKARAAALASFDALSFVGNPAISIKSVESRLLESRSGKERWACDVHCEILW